MAPSTVLLCLLLASALLIGPRRRRVSAALSLVVAAAGLALLAQWALRVTDVEEWLTPARPFSASIVTGRMSPFTAGSLEVLGVALMLAVSGGRRSRQARDAAAAGAVAIGLLGLVATEGYVGRSPFLYGGSITPVALPTALVLMLLSAGAVAATGPSAWPTREFVGPSVRARLLRILMPLFPAMVLAEGLVERATEGSASPALQHAFVMLAFAALGMGVAIRVSRHMDQVVAEAQSALRESEEHHLTLAASVKESIITIDSQGIITGWNRGAERMFGYSSQEVVGGSVEPLMPERFRGSHRDRIGQLGRGAQPRLLGETMVMEGRRKGGEAFPIELSLSGWQTRKGRFFTGIIRDITERKRTEEALAESERRFRRVFEQALTGNFISTVGGRLLACNQAFARILGFDSVEEAKASDARSFYPTPGDRERSLDALRRQGSTEGEIELRRKDGRSVPVIESVIGIAGPDGELAEIQGSLLDMAAHKDLEDRLRQAQKMEAVGQLAGGVAHEFNNLLAVILGHSELLLGDIGSQQPALRRVQEILKAGGRAATLTRQLLAFGRKQLLQPTELCLGALVHAMEEILRYSLGEKVELVTISDPQLGRVKADRGLMEEVVMNLAANARDAMPDGGRLTIELRNVEIGGDDPRHHAGAHAGPHVLLAVGDTGTGMDEATQARIFEPFFTTRRVGEGTGLGLSTAHGIVSQSGGHLEVESAPGRGTVVRVYLPRVS